MGDAATPSSYQSLYRACIKEAAAQGAGLMQAALARALQQMPLQAAQSADVVERHLLADAAEVLREQQQVLAEGFAHALLAEFAQAIAGDRDSSLTFDSLPLLAEDEVQDNMALVRAGRALEAAVQPQWQALEALLATVHGAGGPQRHPLRPGIYLRSLYRLARQSPVSPGIRRRWLQHLGEAMAPALAQAYEALAAMLRERGVTAPAAALSRGGPPADRATQLTIRELQRLLVGADAAAGSAARTQFVETEFSATVPAAFEALRELQKVDQVIQELRQRQAAVPASAEDSRSALRQALRARVSNPSQALGLEVVHQMLEHLAGDTRLLPPVRDVVRELEPVLLRLALADPRFFSDRAHPARQLLEQVTQRSLAWTATGEAGFAEFLEGLQQAVEALLDARVIGPEAFEIALATLQESWDYAQPRGRRARERAVRALLRAEQRNLLAERIAQQVRARPDAAAAPVQALEFLAGPWAQVMAQARLADTSGAEDPHGHGWVVTTLLWSVQPALAARVAAQEAQLAARIEEGLASIDHLPAETARWQELLARLRRAAAGGAASATAAQPQPGEPDTWLAPLEVHESGFVPAPAFAPAAPAAGDDSLPAVELRAGAWVDLHGSDGWVRWQLTWASPHGLLFMFTHASGITRSMTRRRAQQLLAEGQLRLVSARGVVDRALDAVARAAWEHSERTEGGPE